MQNLLDGRHMPHTPITDLWQLMSVTVHDDDNYINRIQRPDGRTYAVNQWPVHLSVTQRMLDSSNDQMAEIERVIVEQFNRRFHSQIISFGGLCRYEIQATPYTLRHFKQDKAMGYSDLKAIIPSHRYHDFAMQMEPPLLSGQQWQGESSMKVGPSKLMNSYRGSYLGIEIHELPDIETGLLFSTHNLWLWIEKPFRVVLKYNKHDMLTDITGNAAYAMGLDYPELWARIV